MTAQVRVEIDSLTGYFANIDAIRAAEYPSLNGSTYLDHAGTTLYPKSLIDAFSKDLTSNLFGNPHSASASSQRSTRRVDDVRLEILRFVNADPDAFDVVFTANATAAIKLVADAFRDDSRGFEYAYHVDSHTSLIGVRELAVHSECLVSDASVAAWLMHRSSASRQRPALLAYPGQSNMTGYRHSLNWSRKVNDLPTRDGQDCFTLFDAAALASTAPLDLSDISQAPSYTAISFYKIFGFPDLGALIVRKDAAHMLVKRRYFGGGTVEAVAVLDKPWHATKDSSIHARLEDGTLPFHNIIALQHAMRIHRAMFRSMSDISRHCQYLVHMLRQKLSELAHDNGAPVCRIYCQRQEHSIQEYGPVIALNLLDKDGHFISNTEVEKLATVRNIHLRTGGLCNPGGMATALGLTADDLRQSHAAGYRCGNENDLLNGKPSGTIRLSFGATSSLLDVETFVSFLREFYVDDSPAVPKTSAIFHTASSGFLVESLAVFPIKSCAAFNIPADTGWEVGPRGLAWDREWCLVHQGTRQALSQKKYPRMALLRPIIDLQQRTLHVSHNIQGHGWQRLSLALDESRTETGAVSICGAITSRKASSVCGESVDIEHYTSATVARFFTDALGVPCTLARFPRTGVVRKPQIRGIPGISERCIALANESPILLISRSSVNRVNEQIKGRGSLGRAVPAESFRGNIVVSEELRRGETESPYVEDDWTTLSIKNDSGSSMFEVLGPCQRCQMVSIDQADASRKQEPFSTLAKTRRRDGKVWFGMHLSLLGNDSGQGARSVLIKVGDRVEHFRNGSRQDTV